ncbi:uncharacterized protein LOC142787110 isoform X3 [Rhipicephalus microplus]|uniref:uncharacterized protein LOC142787110 isoform X3 n=1 Tax=Rhipicephalus microplus TaxID=6941 RepID=UPI003F6A7A4D
MWRDQMAVPRLSKSLDQSSKIMAEGTSTDSQEQQWLLRVSEAQRAIVLAFMEEHPQLAAKAIELGHGFTDPGRLWQELSDALNREGPAHKKPDEWQAWWGRQVHEARRDAAAIKEAQTGTGGGRLPSFRGRILQLTGMARFSGVTGLPYQEQADVPTALMEEEATEAVVGGSNTVTQTPCNAQRLPAAPDKILILNVLKENNLPVSASCAATPPS